MVTKVFNLFFVCLLATSGVSWLISLACEPTQKAHAIQAQTAGHYAGVLTTGALTDFNAINSNSSVVKLLTGFSKKDSVAQQHLVPMGISAAYWEQPAQTTEQQEGMQKSL